MRWLSIMTCVLGAIFLFWITAFKVVDSDFWWHVKAGQLLWQEKQMIALDPFAYTRVGQAYLATHEWLAQLLLFGVFSLFGGVGIAILRWLCGLLMFGSVLAIDPRRLWPNTLLAIAGAIVVRQGLIERPQLFSNVLFAAVLFFALRLLDAEQRERWKILALLCALQVLWVNLHGAAALLSLPILGAVGMQLLWDHRGRKQDWIFLGTALGALLLSMLISPNGWHNLTYVFLLFTDQTAQFIEEWSPHALPQYLSQMGIFWLTALVACMVTQRDRLALLLLLFGIGLLSRTASRHEVLFVLTALACTVHALKHAPSWQRWLDASVRQHPVIASALSLLCIGLLVWIDAPYRAFLEQTNRTGFGTQEWGAPAYAFLEEHGITGPMFNTYSLGGYLLYRGAPERKVFVDGRNVDYGYEFLHDLLAARTDRSIFDTLTKRYDFSYAVVQYRTSELQQPPFDYSFLDMHPDWALVFLDDHIAVYLRRTPEHRMLIEEVAYRLLTPAALRTQSFLSGVTSTTAVRWKEELTRAAAVPENIDALLALAALRGGVGAFADARAHLQEAMDRAPARIEPLQLRVSIEAAAGRWQDAAALADRMLLLARRQSTELRLDRLIEIYARAGETAKAEKVRRIVEAER